MNEKPSIKNVIFDFDGTCTQIPLMYESFLEKYFQGLKDYFNQNHLTLDPLEWEAALKLVYESSPKRGWTALDIKPSAPVAADPFIWVGEVSNDICKKHALPLAPSKIYTDAYNAYPAAWRTDARDTFQTLIHKEINVSFISNSSPETLKKRLTYLMPGYVDKVKIHGNASKYKEINATVPDDEAQRIFKALPENYSSINELERDAFLHRGAYFDAIYNALDKDLSKLPNTLFCGDIWELDLAMPYMLGANIHLLKRAAPFNTYLYEEEIVKSYGNKGMVSTDISDVLNWF